MNLRDCAWIGGGMVIGILMLGLMVAVMELRNTVGKRAGDPIMAGGVKRLTPGTRMTRGEFERLVLGKTPDQVREALGDPDLASDDGGEWRYDGVTYVPPAKRSDLWAIICFEGPQGSAGQVRYPRGARDGR